MANPTLQNENALLLGQKRILEMVATGAPLADTLAELMLFIEAQEPGLRCGILIVADDEAHFRRGSGPNLPEAYHRALDGVPITPPYLGPCGQAAHQGAPVIVPDIASDSRWPDMWRDLVTSCGLAACRSTPVRGSDGRVLASFAIYYDYPRDPHLAPAHLIEIATHLAGIALERERDEEALRRSRQDLEDFFENGTVGLHWVAGDGTILRANQAELDLLGYRAEEYIGRHIMEFHADPPAIEDILARLSRGERLDKYEARLRAKDGTIRHVLISSNVRFRDGRFVNTRCFTVDVTERKRTEDERARLAAIVAASGDAIYSWTFDGTITSWNFEAERLYGYSAKEAIGSSIFTLMPPERAGAERAVIEEVRHGGVVRQHETVRLCKDGRRIDVAVTVSPVADAAGDVVALSTVARDITERKRAEATEQRLAAIVGSSDDAILSKDLDGIIMSWNGGAERLFGYAAEDVIGQPVTILIPPDRDDEEPGILAHIRRGERVGHYDTIRRRKDGSLVEISLAVAPIKGAEDRIVGASSIARDITERRRAEAHRELLMAELDHRVKNTLATVQSIALATLQSDERMEVLVGRLSALAHAHSLLAESRWEGAGLAEIVAAALAPYRDDGDAGRVAVAGQDVRLRPRAAQTLSMAMHELATNAAKYGALSVPEGRLDVSWTCEAESFACAGPPDARQLTLDWVESGGPPVRKPDEGGFGCRLIEQGIAYELGGAACLEYRPDGLRCTLTIPLAEETPGR